MKLVFMGPQGSGKGTQAQILKDELKIPHISTGDIFREAAEQGTEMGIKAKEEYWEKGNLVPDEITNQIVKERLEQEDCKAGFILDGYPRTLDQAQALDEITKIDHVILINISDEESIKRISGRRTCKECGKIYHVVRNPPPEEGKCECGGEIIQRDDDTEEKLKTRLKAYHEQTQPVVEYYKQKGMLKEVNGEQEKEAITAEIKKLIL